MSQQNADGENKVPKPQNTSLLPTNWKSQPPDTPDSSGVGITKRYPSLPNPDGGGYQFNTCVGGPEPGNALRLATASGCSGYTGYGAIPTTLFAVDESYRFTMSQIGPFLEDIEKQVMTLADSNAEPWKAIEASVRRSFQEEMDVLHQRLERIEEALDALRQNERRRAS
jgi:hypothetical protein